MNNEQKHALLKVARDTVEAVITGKRLPVVEADDPDLGTPPSAASSPSKTTTSSAAA